MWWKKAGVESGRSVTVLLALAWTRPMAVEMGKSKKILKHFEGRMNKTWKQIGEGKGRVFAFLIFVWSN